MEGRVECFKYLTSFWRREGFENHVLNFLFTERKVIDIQKAYQWKEMHLNGTPTIYSVFPQKHFAKTAT